jgi:hypothetical protein
MSRRSNPAFSQPRGNQLGAMRSRGMGSRKGWTRRCRKMLRRCSTSWSDVHVTAVRGCCGQGNRPRGTARRGLAGGFKKYPSCDSGCAPWSWAIPRRPRASRGATEGVRDHVARDQRAVEHQIDRRRQLGGVRRPCSFALSRCQPQEPPIMVFEPFSGSAPRGKLLDEARYSRSGAPMDPTPADRSLG